MIWCDDCKRFHFEGEGCYPKWDVREKDTPDSVLEIHASDAEHAAERYGEICDREFDHAILEGFPIEVEVRRVGDRNWTRYHLSGRMEPTYQADLVR